MGLQDRHYYADEPGRFQDPRAPRPRSAGPGLPDFKRWSVTHWLIAVNALIFVSSVFLANSGVPVDLNTYAPPKATLGPGAVAISKDYFRPDGSLASPDQLRRVGQGPFFRIYTTADGRVLADPVTGGPARAADAYVMDPLHAYGHFSTQKGFGNLQVWRLITFQFLHAGPLHLLFNMIGLWIFGRLVEEALGRKKYLAFYLACGIFGGLTYLALNLAGYLTGGAVGAVRIPGLLINQPGTPLIGASAGVFGVIMAAAFIRPNDLLRLLFPPVTLRIRTLAYAYVGLAMFNLLVGGQNAGGDAAHIGGALAGFFFIRRPHLLTDFFDVLSDSRKARRSAARAPAAAGDDREIDRILAKVHEKGLASLTESERDRLRESSQRLQKRA
ncbi:MAG: rhomboid family intramembrane serine protease [Phycisphaeraceae bacterium]|nr:MAG: rhomboid family intramembrane serine protease [Phycisphaeraceae bacterium]